jgi:hypothetical protein
MSSTAFTASTRLAGVDRWCMTAIEMAKSNVPGGCGRERLSATMDECGACCFAILTRLVELWSVKEYSGSSVELLSQEHTDLIQQ